MHAHYSLAVHFINDFVPVSDMVPTDYVNRPEFHGNLNLSAVSHNSSS